jgi:hypothetical protein
MSAPRGRRRSSPTAATSMNSRGVAHDQARAIGKGPCLGT